MIDLISTRSRSKMPTGEGAERERALARSARERAAEERRLAGASDGDERAGHEEAARRHDDAAWLYERLADIYDEQDRDTGDQ
jgi:hypothetical protein